jgi:hypothetical protein
MCAFETVKGFVGTARLCVIGMEAGRRAQQQQPRGSGLGAIGVQPGVDIGNVSEIK